MNVAVSICVVLLDSKKKKSRKRSKFPSVALLESLWSCSVRLGLQNHLAATCANWFNPSLSPVTLWCPSYVLYHLLQVCCSVFASYRVFAIPVFLVNKLSCISFSWSVITQPQTNNPAELICSEFLDGPQLAGVHHPGSQMAVPAQKMGKSRDGGEKHLCKEVPICTSIRLVTPQHL